MDNQIVSALIGAFVVLSGIAVLAALVLGFKAIGVWVRSTFKGKEYISVTEAAEIRETVEALKMQAKSTVAPK